MTWMQRDDRWTCTWPGCRTGLPCRRSCPARATAAAARWPTCRAEPRRSRARSRPCSGRRPPPPGGLRRRPQASRTAMSPRCWGLLPTWVSGEFMTLSSRSRGLVVAMVDDQVDQPVASWPWHVGCGHDGLELARRGVSLSSATTYTAIDWLGLAQAIKEHARPAASRRRRSCSMTSPQPPSRAACP